jgi:dihydropteroate synthase
VRPATTWSVGGDILDIAAGGLVGILNVTPDSFSDGGEHPDASSAVIHGLEMVEMGAMLVDVGGESTRPGATPVEEDVELRRVLPVVEGLVASGVRVSIDTYKPDVARAALAMGACVVNDVTGFRDPDMIDVVASSDCGLVTMHMKGRPIDMHLAPTYEDVVAEVEEMLLSAAGRVEAAGVAPGRIVIDPGLGFGKRAHHSLALLANLGRLAQHGYPVMVGTSRKGFLAKTTGDSTREGRDTATAIATALAYTRGARLFRVHDVARSRAATRLAAAIVAP